MLSFHSYSSLQIYESTWAAMREFTLSRDEHSADQLWFLEHFPVFTQGQAGKAEHLLNTSEIPIVQSDRGGQITYHGPGQLMIYCLFDLKRLNMNVRGLVSLLEQIIIELLASFGIPSHARKDAPGVYTHQGDKIASLGLRIRQGKSYHGISLNVDMDLRPFQQIRPCGLANVQMTQMSHFVKNVQRLEVEQRLQLLFNKRLSNHDLEGISR
jgi:lipoyl(octanoyl) transferase